MGESVLVRLSLGVLALAFAPVALSQKSATDSIAEYRAMLQDGNPADLYEAKGEALWSQARGPNKVSLAQCDLGRGPGVVKGAWAELPRYFADTQQVQDVESRLLTCMETLQGFDAKTIRNTAYGQGEQANITALATWVASESKDMPFKLPQSHPEEKRMFELGRQLFYYRAGSHDFSCATCHGQDNKRIRLQELPNLSTRTGAGQGFGAWPAYRVSNGQMWGMQLRLNDCYRQQRFPYALFGSEASIALSVFMGVTATGVQAAAPAIRR
jgi:sulfur-oxidizing protein SoxA